MRFGLQIETYRRPHENHFDTMLAVAREAERLGFESLWYEDHFMWRDDEHPEKPSPQLECMLTLSAIAAATERIQIGSLVVGVPYRNPALLAKMWATLDVISHGRSIIGLGAGWHEQEFRAYGWPFGSVKERMEQLEDAVQIIDRMLTTRPASYDGKHHSIDRALNDPPPIQRPRPPIMIAGNGERRTLRLVAQHADMCNVYGSVEEVAHRFEVLRKHCDDVGRPYDSITRTINYWALVAHEKQRADKQARYPEAWAIDTPQQTVDNLRRYEEVGAQYAIVKLLDAADLDGVRLFAEEVVPALAR